jgi:hypothetical protein
MRTLINGSILAARAIAGLHVVTLAWDFVDGQAEAASAGLLGFGVERAELKDGNVVEKHFLRGIKRFKDKDAGLPPGTPVPTSDHPVQSFQWGDYTASPRTTYRYRVVPVYGSPKLLEVRDASSVTVEVTTEGEEGGEEDGGGKTRHDVYFNRGVAGSQAYARKFGSTPPDPDAPQSEQMVWLSRGLFEALNGFIRKATGPDAADYQLRAMLYEFHYPPVGQAFKDAIAAGADVDIRFEAQSYKEDNETMIAQVGIDANCKPQVVRAGIRHNKFIVLIHKGVPIAVWTGSTNISAGGIFGHSNVGHAIWDSTIATRFLAYWQALASPTVTTAGLKKLDNAVEATPKNGSEPPADRILTLFSPRDPTANPPTLAWYADRLKAAQRIVCMTFAFGLDQDFVDAMSGEQDSLNYWVFDKAPTAQASEVRRNKNTVIAVGAKLEKGDFENFLGEQLTGFNKNQYIHDKYSLLDPLTDDPVVVTGTANFSRPSQYANDENMLVIRGNLRVADVYFGEFMRIFDHLYARYVISTLRKSNKSDPNAGFLKETTAEWLPPHLSPGPKSLRRQYFMGR